MHWIDFVILAVYLIFMLGVGFFFLKKNKNADDYFVGGRQMSSIHIGLSVVATDVGGGFLLVWVVWALLWAFPKAGYYSPV